MDDPGLLSPLKSAVCIFRGSAIMEERGDIMDNGIQPEILDRITKVCICRAIPRSKIKEAIRSGADSVVKVNALLGSGSGECRGRRCGMKIKILIDEYKAGVWE